VAEDALIRKVRRVFGRGARQEPGDRAPVASSDEPTYGPKPEVLPERTHYGPAVDALVERARHQQRRYGVNADYDVVREHFDHYHYLLQATELHERADADPIRIFLRSGAAAKCSPEINFSMRKYLERHPEHKNGPERSPYLEWLKRGKDAGEIADPADGVEVLAPLLGLTATEVVDKLVALRTDTVERLRSGTLGEMFAKATAIEPLIGEAWPVTADMKQLPFRNESVARAVAAIHGAHQEAGFRPARVVILASGPHTEVGERVDARLAEALGGRIGTDEVVVLYTDHGGAAPEGRLPAGVREVDFASRLDRVGPGVQEEALVALLRSFAAEAIVTVDSELFYRILPTYGRALSNSERLFLYFFHHQEGPLGNKDGHGLRWLYQAFDNVVGVITHDDDLRSELIEHFQLSDTDSARVHSFSTPVPTVLLDWLVPGTRKDEAR